MCWEWSSYASRFLFLPLLHHSQNQAKIYFYLPEIHCNENIFK